MRRAAPSQAVLALALAALAVPAVLGDRELFTLDCQLQVHFLAGTPFSGSGGANAVDGFFDHVVDKFRERLKCHCPGGNGMATDEFNRKFHPLPAIFNHFSKTPNLGKTCNTEYDMLHEDLANVFRDSVHPSVDTRSASFDASKGLLPCTSADVGPGGNGCAFKLKSSSTDIPVDLGIALKTCPDSDVPFISVVLQGDWADNLGKPCNTGPATCSNGLQCKDVTEVQLRRRRDQASDYITQALPPKYKKMLRSIFSRVKLAPEVTKRVGLRAFIKKMGAEDLVDNITTRVKKYFEKSQILSSLRASYRKLTGKHAPASPSDTINLIKDTLTDLIIDVGDQLSTEQRQLRRALNKRRRGRGLLAWSSSEQTELNKATFETLDYVGYYGGGTGSPDGNPEDGGCLPMSTIVARARAFSQVFFPDATVDSSMTPSLDFCLPDVTQLESFGRDNFGIEVKSEDPFLIKIPIHTWDGSMSRGRNVFSADRLDGSAFVGAADALKPPAIDKAEKTVPLIGTTCSGASYMQAGDKFGFGGMARGMTSIIDFTLEQVGAMQVCRAKARDGSFIMSRRTLLPFFGLWTPMWMIEMATIPPAGQELDFEMTASEVKNPWKADSSGIAMNTPMNRLVGSEWNLDDPGTLGIQLDFSDVDSCTAKGYPFKGCMMAVDVRKMFTSLDTDFKAIMGVKQCFSTAKTVPLSAEGLAVQGEMAMIASPLKSCTRVADCPQSFTCELGLSGEIKNTAEADVFALFIHGDSWWDRRVACASRKGEDNIFVAELLGYYTGSGQSSTEFGICIPIVEITFDENTITRLITTEEVSTYTKIKLNALEAFNGKLPGVADQKSVLFVFPPSSSERYTWPHETARRVQWVTFNIPTGAVVVVKLMKGGAEVKSFELSADDAEMFSTKYAMPGDVATGTGYYIELCEGQCWQSGLFEVVAKKENLPEPVPHKQIVLGDPDVLTPGSEALSVFLAAQVPNIAMTLNVASHRIEVTGVSSVEYSSSRRATTSSAMEIQMLIHPDATGQDGKLPEDLLEELVSEDVQAAVTANNGLYLSSAQSSDANLTTLSDEEFSDPAKQKEVKDICEAGGCTYIYVAGESTGLSVEAIIGIAVGASVGGCCCCVAFAAAIYFLCIKKKVGASEAAPPAQAPGPAPGIPAAPARLDGWQQPAAPAVQGPVSVPAVQAIFCGECGTPGAGQAFCGKCGAKIGFNN